MHHAGPTALQLTAVGVRAAAPGPGKGRERSDLAASRPDLIVPDPIWPLRIGGLVLVVTRLAPASAPTNG